MNTYRVRITFRMLRLYVALRATARYTLRKEWRRFAPNSFTHYTRNSGASRRIPLHVTQGIAALRATFLYTLHNHFGRFAPV